MTDIRINVSEMMGDGYDDFWRFKGRYRVVKGGRGSKKSTTTALWIVIRMMRTPSANTLVLRRYFNTHRNSTFAQIQWAINRMGVGSLWKATMSPLEMTFKPTGQKIIFRGLDDPQSITSITVEKGHICWCWWEEAFQINDESAFDKVDLSLRGQMPKELFIQHTMTLNPWSDKHWIKRRFFDSQDNPDIMAITRNYTCNEFLSDADLALFERMKVENPRRFAIEGNGEWGISEGQVFENWETQEFDVEAMRHDFIDYGERRYIDRFGLDFGFSQDPTAFIHAMIDTRKREIYLCNEIYKTHLLIDDMYREIKALGFDGAEIIADSAQPGTIAELKKRGLIRIKPAKKGQNSVRDGIARLQDYKIIIHPKCTNAIVEFSNYVWAKDKMNGQYLTVPVDEFNHIIDALRYATEGLGIKRFSW
ncbi:MAG: PBSX family phage terminase large subunit [Proteobacteria bacterium]|nr:PBSX family phage terminase large subunit [Pseudomonadota bacterium]